MAEKTCRVCLVAKDTGDFYIARKGGKEYVDSYCRECSRKMARERYAARGTEYQRLQSAKFRMNNPHKAREYALKFREKHRGYYRRYRDTIDGRALHLQGAAMRNAKAKGIEFSLERSWVMAKLHAGVCEMTGLPLCFERPKAGKARNPRAPSLDRVDPTQGYVPSNVKVVCWQYNAAKSEYGVEVLNEMVEALAQRLDNQQGSPVRGTFNDHPARE